MLRKQSSDKLFYDVSGDSGSSEGCSSELDLLRPGSATVRTSKRKSDHRHYSSRRNYQSHSESPGRKHRKLKYCSSDSTVEVKGNFQARKLHYREVHFEDPQHSCGEGASLLRSHLAVNSGRFATEKIETTEDGQHQKTFQTNEGRLNAQPQCQVCHERIGDFNENVVRLHFEHDIKDKQGTKPTGKATFCRSSTACAGKKANTLKLLRSSTITSVGSSRQRVVNLPKAGPLIPGISDGSYCQILLERRQRAKENPCYYKCLPERGQLPEVQSLLDNNFIVPPCSTPVVLYFKEEKKMDKGEGQDGYSSTVNGSNGSNTESQRNESTESNNCAPSPNEYNLLFPFQPTPSGNLKINQNQVAYDSRRVSIIVSDPKNTKVNLKEKSSCEEENVMLTIPVLNNVEEGNSLHDYTESGDDDYFCCTEDSEDEGHEVVPCEISLSRLGIAFHQEEKVDWSRISVPKKDDVMTALYQRVKSGLGADCTVKIDTEEFPCHLLLLECYSEFFVEHHGHEIILPKKNVTPRAFKLIYEWMLSSRDEFHILSRENILEIITAAHYLKIKELEEQCWAFVDSVECFSEETAFLLYSEAKRYNNTCIMKLMLPRIVNFFYVLVASKDFLELDADEVCTLLQSNTIAVYSEMDVFMSAVRWLNYDWQNRKTYTTRIISCIRFGLILPWHLVQIQRNNRNREIVQVARNQDVQRMIEDGLAYSISKHWYADITNDSLDWVEELGLKKPVPRNFLTVPNEDQPCLHYREFLRDLDKIKVNIIKQQKKQRRKYLEEKHSRMSHGIPFPAPQVCVSMVTTTPTSHTLPPSVSQQNFEKEPESLKKPPCTCDLHEHCVKCEPNVLPGAALHSRGYGEVNKESTCETAQPSDANTVTHSQHTASGHYNTIQSRTQKRTGGNETEKNACIYKESTNGNIRMTYKEYTEVPHVKSHEYVNRLKGSLEMDTISEEMQKGESERIVLPNGHQGRCSHRRVSVTSRERRAKPELPEIQIGQSTYYDNDPVTDHGATDIREKPSVEDDIHSHLPGEVAPHHDLPNAQPDTTLSYDKRRERNLHWDRQVDGTSQQFSEITRIRRNSRSADVGLARDSASHDYTKPLHRLAGTHRYSKQPHKNSAISTAESRRPGLIQHADKEQDRHGSITTTFDSSTNNYSAHNIRSSSSYVIEGPGVKARTTERPELTRDTKVGTSVDSETYVESELLTDNATRNSRPSLDSTGQSAEIIQKNHSKYRDEMSQYHAATIIKHRVKDFLNKKAQIGEEEEDIPTRAEDPSIFDQVKNLLSDKSLYLPDEEAVLVFGGMDPHMKYGVDRNLGTAVYRYNSSSKHWDIVAELPEPRHHHSAIIFKDLVFIIGGADPRNEQNGASVIVGSVLTFDPATKEWGSVTSLKTARKHCGVAVIGGQLYVIGGQGSTGRMLSSVERFSDGSWEEVAPLAVGRSGIATATYKNLIWAAGGMTTHKKRQCSKVVECYDPRKNVWIQNKDLRLPRCFASLSVMDDTLYLIGGAGKTKETGTTASMNAVDVWDLQSQEWKLRGELHTPRHNHSVASYDKQLLIMGGVTTMYMRTISSVECYDCERGTRTNHIEPLPQPLSGHASVTLPCASVMRSWK